MLHVHAQFRMVRQVTDGSEYVFHPHVHGRLGVICALEKVEQVETHPDALEPQPVIDGNHPVAVLGEEFEPGHHPRVVPTTGNETAAEDIQDGGTVQGVAGDLHGLVHVHEQVAGIALGDLVSGFFLREGQGAQQQGHERQNRSFHRWDSMSSTSLSTASLSGMCRRTGSLPR